jgi:hypothetical protein
MADEKKNESVYDKIKRQAQEKQDAQLKQIPLEERLKNGGLQR